MWWLRNSLAFISTLCCTNQIANKPASVGWCQPSDKEILADYSSCVLRGYKKWILVIFITLWKYHLFMPYKNYLINFHLKSMIAGSFLFSTRLLSFCVLEFILIITKNAMTHNRIPIVPCNVSLCVQFGDVWLWMGLWLRVVQDGWGIKNMSRKPVESLLFQPGQHFSLHSDLKL